MYRTNRVVMHLFRCSLAALMLASCGARRDGGMETAPTPNSPAESDGPMDGTGFGYSPAPEATSSTGAATYDSAPASAATPGREKYSAIYENDYLSASNNPLSTFAVDVDGASYTNVRRFIGDGQLPPADAVRVEELLNYFSYSYPAPRQGEPVSITTEMTECPWNREHRLVRIGLRGAEAPQMNASAKNLVFLIDVSGSMAGPDKLPLLKSGLSILATRLGPQDRVAIVTYAGSAGVALPSTPGSEKGKILEAINDLKAGGATAGEAGITMAYEIARRNFIGNGNNRVVLATDGDFNVGAGSTPALINLIEQQRRGGIFLTVLGFGKGNLNDAGMEQLADKGNGAYYYIDGMAEAVNVLSDRMASTLHTVAKDVKIQVEFNPAQVREYRLIGYENRALAAEEFNDDNADGGEIGAGQVVTALYEIVPAGNGAQRPRVDPLRYQPSVSSEPGGDIVDKEGIEDEVMMVKVRYKLPTEDVSRSVARPVIDRGASVEHATRDMRLAAAVAEWGLLLRNSKYRGTASIEQVLALAGLGGEFMDEERAQFITLVQRSAPLMMRRPV